MKLKAVPVKTDSVGSKRALPNFGVVVKRACPKKVCENPVVVVVVLNAKLGFLRFQLAWYEYAQENFSILLNCAKGRTVVAFL